MTKFKTFVEQINLYKEGDNPIFGNSVISVSIEDEAAGPYFIINQCNDDFRGELRLDFDEVKPLFEVMKKMMKGSDYE